VGKTDRQIKAAVAVGLGQLGAVKLFLEGQLLTAGVAPLGQTPIGPASEVKGKLLTVEARVDDVSEMTNKMSVVIRLTGGPSAKTITANGEVDTANDSIIFETAITLRE
jgi:hypothetical protein